MFALSLTGVIKIALDSSVLEEGLMYVYFNNMA
jgi:hypothetical protein